MSATSRISDVRTLDPFDLMREHFSQPADVLRDLAHSKRFLERYSGDSSFREAVLTGDLSLEAAAQQCGCRIDLSTLVPVFDPAFVHHRPTATLETWRLTYLWNEHLNASGLARSALLMKGDSGGLNPRFDAWRGRNVNRAALQLGATASGITHPPVAFELSSGCSVGCWFCGISAQAFKGHATLQDGGADNWREILNAVKSVVGPGIRCGFCYWATDPLDNPEYLGFLKIYEEIAGSVPQTTTAIPLRNVTLTRDVLSFWETRRSIPNRFSVMTKRALLQVHDEFSPEELLGVELNIQVASEGGIIKFRSGRTYTDEVARKRGEKEKYLEGTIACVSGFLINIVERTVKLISPVMPSAEYPNGYITFDERTFDSPQHLKSLMWDIVDANMSDSLAGDQPISITSGGVYDPEHDRCAVRFRDFNIHNPQLSLIGELLERGELDPISIVRHTRMLGEQPLKTIMAIENLWREGVISQAAAPKTRYLEQVEAV